MVHITYSAAPLWRTSSRSGGSGNCVEVAFVDGRVLVRDSKDPAGGVLDLDTQAWTRFLAVAQEDVAQAAH